METPTVENILNPPAIQESPVTVNPHENGEVVTSPAGHQERIVYDSDDGSLWHKEVV